LLVKAQSNSILALGSPPARFASQYSSQGGKNCFTDQDSFGFEDVATDKYREVKD
jgi:hypothetical protein